MKLPKISLREKRTALRNFAALAKKKAACRLETVQKFAHYLSTTIKLFMLIKFKKGIFKLFSVFLKKGLKRR